MFNRREKKSIYLIEGTYSINSVEDLTNFSNHLKEIYESDWKELLVMITDLISQINSCETMYSELKNVEIPIIKTLEKLGWLYYSSSKLDSLRQSYSNPFIDSHLKEALNRLNKDKSLNKKHIEVLIKKLRRLDDNEEFHYWLKGERTFKPTPESKAIL